MKRALLILLSCGYSFALIAQPDTWTQKNDLGWNGPNGPTARSAAVGFNIGGKGFVGTGNNGINLTDPAHQMGDFFAYDPVLNTWSKKAGFGGTSRVGAAGFSIGGKGYIGTGADSIGIRNDFWEYDPMTDTWTQKADFGGTARSDAVGFSIGNKGYIGTGQSTGGNTNDFWQYDPVANSWTQKANFGGDGRLYAVGFSIGGRGFIGTGLNPGLPGPAGYRNDFWEYDTAANTWTQKANCGGNTRARAVGFGIGSRGYIGTGANLTQGSMNDFWEYDTTADTWTQKASFGGTPRILATGFAIAGNGYIGTGNDGDNKNDFWKYDTTANTWTPIGGFGVAGRAFPIGFGIGSKGYVGLGNGTSFTQTDFWEYDPATGYWTQKADYAGTPTDHATGFSVGSKGYVASGALFGTTPNEFWQFDPVANTWARKADFAGSGRISATGFGIGGKGYLGTGTSGGTYVNDFWEYDTLSNTWTQKANFGGAGRTEAAGFSIGGKGYLGTGVGGNDFWQYDPGTDTWTRKADFAAPVTYGAVGFSIDSLGYLGTGIGASNTLNDFWQYNPSTDTWTRMANFGGGPRTFAVGFSVGHNGYIACGEGNTLENDLWQYNTTATIRTTPGDYSVSSACPSLSGTSFSWELDNNNGLVFGIDPNSASLNATCWGTRTLSGTYRDATALFGGSQTQVGAYLPRNYVIMPTTEPTSAVTLRFYFTTQELTDFINYFNTTYGTSYTQSDIRIVRYDGINQDLELSNNSGTPSDYTSITPTSIGNYGSSNIYQYVEFNTASLSEFAIVLTGTPVVPLPLRLLGFTAAYNKGATVLNWQTAQEQNTAWFTIQRSTDGKDFSAIGRVEAAGNSSTIRNFSFTDKNAGSLNMPVLYYRLQEVDLDGHSVFSEVDVVNINEGDNGIMVSPNPATSNIIVKLTVTAPAEATLLLTDLAGRTLITQHLSLSTGENFIPVPLGQFSAGVYNLLVTGSGTKWQTKFVKR